jgi:hypothetical protein
MAKDERNLLDVLRAELTFIEKGGYRHTARAQWRPHYMFQDSPTCLNFDPTQPPKPCSNCVLTQLVPESARYSKVPCRYIPLNGKGETVDSFYRTGTEDEVEAAVVQWLKATIERLEREYAQGSPTAEKREVHVKGKFASAE